MKVYLDLRKVLPKRAQKILAQEIGISHNELKHMLSVDAATIKQEHLSKICKFLIRQGYHESVLPAILFSKRYDRFWPLLSDRAHVAMVTGVRRRHEDWDEVVSAADSVLQSKVQFCLTEDANRGDRTGMNAPSHVIDPQLIESWDLGATAHPEIQQDAITRYDDFVKTTNRGLVLIGSVKSNPMACVSIAAAFKEAKPFVSEDAVKLPNDRSCPFMLLYRGKDVHPKCCCGGTRLSQKREGEGAGIYYEPELNAPWVRVPSDETTDAALVFYRFDRFHDRVEMVLGGYSARATKSLATFLEKDDAGKIEPIISDTQFDVGAYIIKFEYAKPLTVNDDGGRPMAEPDDKCSYEVIPLAKEVLADRLKQGKKRRPRKKTSEATKSKKAKSKKGKAKKGKSKRSKSR